MFIKKEHKDEVEKYIAGIIANNNCKLLAIFCNEYRDMLRKSQINFDEKYLFD